MLAESFRGSLSVYTRVLRAHRAWYLALLWYCSLQPAFYPSPKSLPPRSFLLLLASRVERLSQGDAFHLYLLGNLREVRWGKVSSTYGFEG